MTTQAIIVAPHEEAPALSGEVSDLVDWSRRLTWIGGADLETEFRQAVEEGRDLEPVRPEFDRLLATPRADASWHPHAGGERGLDWQQAAWALMDRVQTLPIGSDYPYDEPNDLASIRLAAPEPVALPKLKLDRETFGQRLHGGLLGRLCGCLLGKPVEAHDRRSIRIHGEATDNWPLTGYLARPDQAQHARIAAQSPGRLPKDVPLKMYAGEIEAMVIDDDVNYTVLGHAIVQHHGAEFRPLDVGFFWLSRLPMAACCTAERVAYRNLANLVLPPSSATYRNPCREWIGATIRADYYGYANPGNPRRAAEWAWRDASISHVRNGIYGEMWAAAMIAAAYTAADWPTVIAAGLAEVPHHCRLAEGVRDIVQRHADGEGWEQTIDAIHDRWDELDHHDWCHTISNAEVLTAALLHGQDNFESIITKAVMAGFDTDCNAATAGSLWGVMHGVDAIPSKWASPLNDRGHSAIGQWREYRISTLAAEMTKTAITHEALA